jgi:hypothetical protein
MYQIVPKIDWNIALDAKADVVVVNQGAIANEERLEAVDLEAEVLYHLAVLQYGETTLFSTIILLLLKSNRVLIRTN